MSELIKEFSENILSLHRYVKRSVAIVTDLALCVLSTWLAFVLRLEELILFRDLSLIPVVISIIIVIPIFWLLGLYRTIFRYTDFSIIFTIFTSMLIYGLLYFLVIGVYGIPEIPRSVGIIQPMLLSFMIIISRLSVKYLLTNGYTFKNKISKRRNVLIYGAGDAGRQLIIALENSPEFKVTGIIDDNQQFHRQVLLGQTIYSPSKLERLIEVKNINLVFLALPSINRNKRNQIIEQLKKYKLAVKTLPSISEIVDGRITVSDIKDLNIEDLLNREQVKPDLKMLNKNINSKIVMVTGAGGSIGSELCRQIIRLKPNKLLLLELNEFALYKIYEELKTYNKDLNIISLLVNAQNQSKLEKIFETFKVDTVYHAAAYKHVPLVEENICEGVENNVFSTLAIAKASILKKVSNLVFVSSDKAVRPTNIMGASKRLAELCMQAINEDIKDTSTNFSIVRFGNVLESSGSVIPKFKNQIKNGGPVTLTHKDVTRYFMTVTEAAQLVIQAGAMGKKSEVFILDMGKSIKIIDLIHKMINLSGLSIKDNKNPKGDIEVKITGLRPGEKLYEELLVGENSEKTNHPRIQKTEESFIPFNQLESDLNNLKKLINENKANEVKKLLDNILKLYKSNSQIVDNIYTEQLFSSSLQKNLQLNEEEKNKVVKIK